MSLKVPSPEPSLPVCQSPQSGALSTCLSKSPVRSPLYLSLKVPSPEPSLHASRSPQSRALFIYLSKSPEKKHRLQVPITEPLHRRCSISRAQFTYIQNSQKRSPPPSRFPSQSPTETDVPFPEPFSTCLSQSPVEEPPPPGSPSGPRWRGRLITYLSKFPIKEPPFQVPLSEPPERGTLHIQYAIFTYL
jgi:hypothetical protein